MKPRVLKALGVYVAAVCLVSVLAFAARMVAPETGLRRFIYTQAGFTGTPIEERTSEIGLEFLKTRPELPRVSFGVRWRGFLHLDKPHSIEFFAGGNDRAELRIDGELLLRRNLAEGMRTIGRTRALNAGAHEIAIDYEQFGGSMALNIQRAIDGGAPGPFQPSELFMQPVGKFQAWVSRAGFQLEKVAQVLWLGLPVMLMIAAAPWAVSRWRIAGAPANARAYARRVWLVAAPALLGPAIVFAVGSHTIFANNRGEFAVTFGELAWPWLLRAVGINWIILFAAGCVFALISDRLTRMYAAVLLALGLLLWGQGNLWNADYGVLAGQEIDLSGHAWRTRHELAAWGAGLVLALALFRPIARVAPFAALVFIGVQTTAAVLAADEPAVAQRARWIEPPSEIYQFSATHNVLHIVLDEFQSDVFSEILQEDREALDRQFSGFQYFIDHAGAFPTTSASMPAMLASREYRNDKPAPEFVREAFKEASIFDKVSKAGYDVDAMSIVPIASFEDWLGPEATPHWKGARFRIRKPFVSRADYREVSARQLLELSLFRHLPHPAKAALTDRPDTFYRALWMDREESPAQVRRHEAANSVAFLEQYTSSMSVGRTQPVYKLLHVGVPHRPIVVDRDCRFLGVIDMSRASYTDQSRCAIKLVAAVLDRARALGIYDSSLIIVSSDHGTDLQPLGFAGKSESLSLTPGPSTVLLKGIVGTAKALMMIKPPNRAGPITISNAPTSHIDLQPTILDLIGLPGGSADSQMFRRDQTQPRTRIYGMYNPAQRFPKAYFDRIDVLTIDGQVVDARAWNVQRLIWRPDLSLDQRDVDIGPRSSHYYLGPGWSFERRETADGRDVTFAQPLTNRAFLSISLPTEAVQLVLRASAPVSGGLQSIGVDVDDRPAARLAPTGRDSYREMVITVPADPTRPRISQIMLQFDSGGRDTFLFKLDRLSVRDR
ncbi:MAG TPA: sulfatase-like hydrolase/transferase [Vicinamibacterales bacterium]|nr:sulfatase-like hydrolase/transferase [Vicinamibacterales bacterium]